MLLVNVMVGWTIILILILRSIFMLIIALIRGIAIELSESIIILE